MVSHRPLHAYVLILPLALGMLLFVVYPVIYTVVIAFYDTRLVTLNQGKFVGFENYRALLTRVSPTFGRIMGTTLAFVLWSVTLQVGLGLALAILLHLRWLRGRSVFRSLFLLPWVTVGVVVGFSWKFVYNASIGILNYAISLVGIAPQAWLSDPHLAMPAVVAANIWKGTCYSLLIQTAGLQSVPAGLYEVGIVDGATKTQSLLYITLPLLAPFLFINLLTETGDTFHVFDRIYTMTGGGPLHNTELLSIFMYRTAFVYGDIGAGAAVAVVELLIAAAFALVYAAAFRGRSLS